MLNRIAPSLLAAFIACALAYSASATPANKAAFNRYFGRFLAKNLQTCTTCHLPSDKEDPDSLDDFPHNPFGAAVRNAGKRLRAQGKKRDMSARIDLIASLDSDGDGVDNLSELLLGHNPGDAKDAPAKDELAQLSEKRQAFALFLKSYRWEPFEPVQRPVVPAAASAWARNPIDAFVAEQQQAHGLSPSPQAGKIVLLRRVYLDLIGLNPTPAEIASYEADRSSDAYEKVVGRLLNDPRYGQRWARHWMDIWRYSDWAGWADGKQIRDSQPHIWRWRDWIVESLNADKGYDRMLTEMLAADELCPEDEGTLRATGFLARNYKLLSREQWLEDTVNHTSRAFLGLTMHCAKCHDHKFDPIAQEEYYRLRAVFEPYNVRIDALPGVADKTVDGLCRVYDKDLNAQTMFYIRGDERAPDKKRGALKPGAPAALGGELDIKPIALPFRAAHPDCTAAVRTALLQGGRKKLEATRGKLTAIIRNAKLPQSQRTEAAAALSLAQASYQALAAVLHAEELEDAGNKGSAEWKAAALAAFNAQRNLAVAQASQSLITAQSALRETRRKLDAAAADKSAPAKAIIAASDKVEAAQKALADAVAALNEPPATTYKPRATDDFPDRSTGRRLAFARWLVDARNPLTARVAVNHIWARHFVEGLVPSVDDFGHNGQAATHPALVDWLASELVANGWRMKPIHRLIVTSAAYRQSSSSALLTRNVPPKSPPNVIPRDAQAARGIWPESSILVLSHAKPPTDDASNNISAKHMLRSELGTDPDDIYLWHFPSKRMEAELVRDNVLYSAGRLDLAMGGPDIDNHLGLTSRRRSLYLRCAPEKEVEFLNIFDGPNPNECYRRHPSVMPQQALALANSRLVTDQAGVLCQSLAAQAKDDNDAFIRAAFLRILARHAADDELAACRQFLTDPHLKPDRARENLVIVLFNHNDFVTIR